MLIRLKTIDWLDGYQQEKMRSLVERGIHRTLSAYTASPSKRAGRGYARMEF
jgi:hypothetical protein